MAAKNASGFFKPLLLTFLTRPNLQLFIAIYSHLQPFTAIPAMTSSFQPFQPFTAMYSHFQPFPKMSSNLQPFTRVKQTLGQQNNLRNGQVSVRVSSGSLA